jgi:glutamate carboxypeptidase
MTHELLPWCEAETDWLVNAIQTLVDLESPSTEKAAVDRCGAELAARLSSLGGNVTRIDGGVRGDHVLADFEGGPKRVLLLGHFDTVWPVGQLDRMPLREDRSTHRLHGPGIFDMKAGIGVAMLAVRALRELRIKNLPHVTMLSTSDEEIGSGSSRVSIEQAARENDAVLVLEPSLPDGSAKTRWPGSSDRISGKGPPEVVPTGISPPLLGFQL